MYFMNVCKRNVKTTKRNDSFELVVAVGILFARVLALLSHECAYFLGNC